ncbi:transcriptional regulator, XRE family with cupin sensor [Streptomyces sp. 1222.5]|uniref:helix-turn-helix domain-containing protein n=1 Tax=unclassified Streptomyces TaxID=2593676 RepID=UPI000894DE4B|nr:MULTISPECIES: helix-turn-helix domain-containing protein [unclassified Streptomyces]PKW11304.1 XRE family transcriptional regulator [Streptomyces sp. 5112.2]SEB82528.1 transcriptional regulator, XRE family with cupin sensor [Streptomyces sp. 1222.5]SEE07942.1 transcriptional regulator, XRE family with cupin sensor [Streptomyces sp. 2231.1]
MRSEDPDAVDVRIGARLAALRAQHGWSLGELAERSGVSRSTLSRAERAETSPTAALLNRLCQVYGRTMSQLLSEVEAGPVPLVRAAEQQVWEDRASGFVRRSVSPPHAGLRGELVEGRLAPGADIAYDRPPVPGLEQHLWVLDGTLEVTDGERAHRLGTGDCLRMRVHGPTRFRCAGPGTARYVLAVVRP